MTDEELKKAAREYAKTKKEFEEKQLEIELPMGAYFMSIDAFLAGAKWQAQQEQETIELAQKELENSDWIKDIREWCYNKGHLEGYAKGQKDAEKQHKEATSFHYDLHPLVCPSCYGGGPCTNPYRDCINCPRTGTSGIAKTDTNIK